MSEKLEARGASGGLDAPIFEGMTPFEATRREIVAAPATYILGYLYLLIFMSDAERHTPVIAAFTVGFVAVAAWLLRDRPRSRESLIWLGCAFAVLAGMLLDEAGVDPLGMGHVWELGEKLLFLHGFAVWWALCRGGAQAEGVTGPLAPLDAAFGVLALPFSNLLLRSRALWHGMTHARGQGERVKPEALLWSALAVALGAGLFALALWLLTAADSGFSELVDGLLGRFDPSLDEATVLRFLLSLPVGAYLYGLLAGMAREDLDKPGRRRARWHGVLAALRRIPNRLWSVLLGGFVLLYLAFFVVQARYLFGAFTRTLPEGFIVSQYARQGFFELCRVMGVNFALLWLATRTSARPAREDRPTRILCLILLGQSLLLAAIALSKLILYMDCFGFTPLRLQSTWLVCVLAAGCVCAAIRLLRGKETFRIWAIFSAITLAGLCLI